MSAKPVTAVFFNARLIDSETEGQGCLIVKDGLIDSVLLGDYTDKVSVSKLGVFDEYVDCCGKVLMPAFIDMHVHFRYPGQTQKEDLDSGLAAAAAGGVGTVVLMPNTNPVVSTVELAKSVMAQASERKMSKVFQTISITKDFAGTDTSGIDDCNRDVIPVISEDGHDVTSTAVMLEGMKKAAEKKIIVACHCEDPFMAQAARPYRAHGLEVMKNNGIPAAEIKFDVSHISTEVNNEIDSSFIKATDMLALAEDAATYRNIEIAKLAGCHIHVCHCSTKNSIDAVRNAKMAVKAGTTKKGFDCTVEVTPHHIALTGYDFPYTRALVNPPLRSEHDRVALIDAIKDGTVDVISTDHAPHTADDKASGSPGFTGIELSFAVCNDVLVKKNGISLKKLSHLMSSRPAELLHLNKGLIKSGYDADLVIVDPDEKWTVDCAQFKSKGKSSPLNKDEVTGRVRQTFIAGKCIYKI